MAATQVSSYLSPISTFQRQKQDTLFTITIGIHMLPKTSSSSKRKPLVRASSKPQRGRVENADSNNSNKATFISQEDLSYLVKLGGGSIAGAAAIKYGSVVFPDITSPNLGLALFMISAPVVVAVLLLIKQSRVAD